MERELHKKFYLSTEGYYFVYRPDKYNDNILRATLFDDKDRQIDSIRVKSSIEDSVREMDKPHTDVINAFESMITLG